jgi:hypothetical protein
MSRESKRKMAGFYGRNQPLVILLLEQYTFNRRVMH